jgi:hypothetical protein
MEEARGCGIAWTATSLCRLSATIASVGALVLASGCSSPQAYGAGQAWQRNECYKINDAQERSRCLASASTSYEEYKRQTEAAKSGK